MKKITSCFLFAFLLFSVCSLAGYRARASSLADTYAQRRAAVMKKMGEQGMLILFSPPAKKFSGDVLYKFRQENNLYYLTGIRQEGTVLVLMPPAVTRKENLFVLDRNPSREVWTGHRLTREEALQSSGISNIYSRSEFDDFIDALLYGQPYGVNRYLNMDEYARFFTHLKMGEVPVFLLLEDHPGLRGQLTPEFEFANRLRERFPVVNIRDASDIFASLRQVKEAQEIENVKRAIDITSDGLLDAIRKVAPGMYEYEVQAVIDSNYTKNGTEAAFPSIIGSGRNSTILHYEENNRKMNAGDLLLMDVGAEFDYYAADITRTVPVDGKFTPAQADVYQIVLNAQEEAIKAIKPGATIQQVHQRAVEVVKQGLLRLGLITDPASDQYRSFFMHGTSHWLGLDVHDVGDRGTAFKPGMILTVEPGIYVRGSLLEELAQDGKNAQWIEKIRPAFEKYTGIGVRIEDDFLVTADGCQHLSHRLPRQMRDIEKLMHKTHSANSAAKAKN
ncbi:MAG TPA: aminopeptidase P family protein [Acidobacteriota bacterium]|jgi:Xaa-Pro aminopeptidase